MISQLTTFVARDAEVAEACRLLDGVRLLTLVGPGGVGKTRLAERIALEVEPSYADGVVYIGLEALNEPELLPRAAAVELGLSDVSADPFDSLLPFLRTKSMLIVLDNCEHMVQACQRFVAAVLAAAPDVRLLATSRHVLGISGEQLLPVGPLTVPDTCAGGTDNALTLFADRATYALPHFAVNNDNCEVVLGICARLDGIPLAIELVVPWLRVMSPRDVLARLDDTFTLLTAEAAARPSRQQTLIAAVDWSFALCSPDEQTLWARASVFADGFTFEAAVAVCTDDDISTPMLLRLLGGLVEKSILIREEVAGEIRLRMLYTIRQYGLRLLAESGQQRRFQGRHLEYFAGLVDRIAQRWCGPDQVELAAHTRREHNNVRAALEFGLGDPDWRHAASRLAPRMQYYWIGCGLFGECRRWLDRVLGIEDLPVDVRQEATWVSAYAAIGLGDLQAAQRLADEARMLAGETGDPLMMANALLMVAGAAFIRGDMATAGANYDECVVWYARAGVLECQAISALGSSSVVAGVCGDFERAVAQAQRAIEIAERSGEQWARSYGDLGLARAHLEAGRLAEAARHTIVGIKAKAQFNELLGLCTLCEYVGWISNAAGLPAQTAEALGAASAAWRYTGSELFLTSDSYRLPRRRCEEAARSALGDERYMSLYAKGALLTNLEDAVDRLLRIATGVVTASEHTDRTLTDRELEVAALVATGAANKEIAARLVISTRTAEKHVANILHKLGLSSRAQLAAWVAQRRASTDPR